MEDYSFCSFGSEQDEHPANVDLTPWDAALVPPPSFNCTSIDHVVQPSLASSPFTSVIQQSSSSPFVSPVVQSTLCPPSATPIIQPSPVAPFVQSSTATPVVQSSTAAPVVQSSTTAPVIQCTGFSPNTVLPFLILDPNSIFFLFPFCFGFSFYLLPPFLLPILKKKNNKVSDVLLTSPFFFLFPFFFSSFFFSFFSSYFSPHCLFPSFFIPFSMPPFYLVCPTNHLKCPAPFEHERTYCTGTHKTYLELC